MNPLPEPPIPSDNPEECVNIGLEHHKKDRHCQYAFQCFELAAGKNHAEAQFNLGCLYYFGESRDADFQQAADWFIKAQKNGYGPALVMLGLMLEEGYTFFLDKIAQSSAQECYDKAHKRYGIAAAEKMAQSLERWDRSLYFCHYDFGLLFYNGDAFPKDYNRAAVFFHRVLSPSRDHGLSWYYVGRLKEKGFHFKGTRFENKTAEDCYRKAADDNVSSAQKRLEEMRKNPPNLSNLTIHDDKKDDPPAEGKFGGANKDAGPSKSKKKTAEPKVTIRPEKNFDDFVGLDKVKSQIDAIKKSLIFNKKRQEKGLPTIGSSNHFVFTGNPGTGKTETARIIGHTLREAGLLEMGHVTEVDRSDLLGEYIGETEQKTKDIIKLALDGVLFIDEAYALYGTGKDYGPRAVDILLNAMENHRDRLVVIMAGYPDRMDMLLRSNAGLKSRIRHHINFDDYTTSELVQIYKKTCETEGYKLIGEANNAVETLMSKAKKLYDVDFGNARFVRNAFEKTIEKMSIRVINNDLSRKTDFKNIMFTDIPSIEEIMGKGAHKSFGINDNIVPLK